ncbi:hypothetical protein [Streptomyces sp. NBU3104]|uniref:hypothetical protein n=1 Tax=Streptomyces sp. NBU3104 TaxID=2911367 RepID=UPI001EDBE0AB|nr:hypothetical protein [Streptomyces sp. NBU3104]UKL07422.1 hypothetical protein L2I08_31185 [Streptomyces sp. NBU3104]
MPEPKLLSQRTALILFIAVTAGGVIGVLTFLLDKSYWAAALASAAAFGCCTVELNKLID